MTKFIIAAAMVVGFAAHAEGGHKAKTKTTTHEATTTAPAAAPAPGTPTAAMTPADAEKACKAEKAPDVAACVKAKTAPAKM